MALMAGLPAMNSDIGNMVCQDYSASASDGIPLGICHGLILDISH